MAEILQHQALTIKQQVEELKNWHKQQQSKLGPQILEKGSLSNKNNENEKRKHFVIISSGTNSNSKVNFDEMPIKVTNPNFNSLMENNVSSVDSHPTGETVRIGEKDSKPKFRFLKKGEGIARFNMGPPKISNRAIPRKHGLSLKLIKDPKKTVSLHKGKEDVDERKIVNLNNVKEIPTLEVPDVKLNFRTWKSILSGENPEDLLEKAISNNQLDLWDPNSSVDSSTFSLMEKLLAIGKNKLSKDREELRVFEAIEQHMLDSSFCSTSSYVTKLMENAVMSTPNKNTFNNQPQTLALISNQSDQIPKPAKEECEVSSRQGVVAQNMPGPSLYSSLDQNHEKVNKLITGEKRLESNKDSIKKNSEQKLSHPVTTWLKPGTVRNQSQDTTAEESIQDIEQSLHVRFAEQVDYKSFIEQSQSIDNINQREGNENEEFDESNEWKEDSEDSSSCCSQCSRNDSLSKDVRSFNAQENQPQSNHGNLQNEKIIPSEKLNVGDLQTNNALLKNDPSLNGNLSVLPPVVLDKLKELEDEIKIFREENNNIKSLRESLEKDCKKIKEEKRQLQLEKKKIQKEAEEERKRLTALLEEEKQKLMKEKIVFEKYSKSLTKNPSREERKEIQILKDQLTEMKEELNKKESRWGAAQARVRNQVRVLEEDNKKLRVEIENFRKQSKYWELFNQNKKGKPFNNTRLIHAISDHISNIVLGDENGLENSGNVGYFNQNSSPPKTSSITQSDLKTMYGVKVIKENNKNTLPNSKVVSRSNNADLEKSSLKKVPSDVRSENCNEVNNFLSSSKDTGVITDLSVSPTEENSNERNLQTEDRCQKPDLEEKTNVIKEVVDQYGNVEVVFPNGNIKKVNKITGSEKYIYINGDVEEVTHDGTVKYYYSKSRIWQTTLPDGLEIVDFPDGKVEKRHVDGTREIIYSNNNKKFSYPDGSQEIIYTDGTRLKTKIDKTQILTLPNGQKEIHTEEWKRREYPDGTTKTLYPDGTTETVYSNGRVRLKDKYGNLVMDSVTSPIS